MTAATLETAHEGGAGSGLGAAAELLAVGGLGLFAFPLAWLLRATLGLSEAELAVGFVFFHAAHFVNDPHFLVTYLLFYRDARRRALDPSIDPAQRRRYVLAGFVVPVVLAAWAVAALAAASAQAIGGMAQAMFLLVGWHYGKQGFGVLVVLAARRGFHFTAPERRAILAHVYAAWAFAWASPASAAGLFEERGVVYWAPARPALLTTLTGGLFALSAVGLVVALGAALRRRGTLPLVPLLGFLVTLWSWTVYSTVDRLVQYAIPALHSLQYLYFVGLLRSNEARAEEGPPTFGPPVRTRLVALAVSSVVLGFVVLRAGPELLDTALALGTAPGGEALGPAPVFAVVYVAVNLHHYVMDHVIWRREHAETRWLFGPG